MNTHLRFVLLLLLLLVPHAITAQTLGSSVSGTVEDQAGQVIAGAEVQTLIIASGRTLKTKTDSTGRYQLSGLLPGSYSLSIKSPGFAVATRSITLHRNESSLENFSLVPGVIEGSVTVTAGKGSPRVAAEAPQFVTVTDASQIEERRPLSTARVIERTPNFNTLISNPALERPRLRGLASNRVLIVVDGDRLNNMRSDPTTGVSPSIIDLTQIESAEVLSGAGSSLYGSDAMAGVINFITTRPNTPEDSHLGLKFNGDFRSNSASRHGAMTINWSRAAFAVRLRGSLFRNDVYHTGNEAISMTDVVSLGNLAVEMGNAVGNNVARTYAVWSLPARAEVLNSEAHGFNDQLDVWFSPGLKHSLRFRQLNSQHKGLGFAFVTPPFDPRMQFNSFRRLDKYGLRYEGSELRTWLPRVTASFYRQKYSFPDETVTSQILLGSSWTLTPELLPQLTGNQSSFAPVNLSQNKNSVTSYGLDLQATFAPLASTLLTTGIGYLRDSSADEFSRSDLLTVINERASNPDSEYRNWGWFNLFEHESFSWLRLTAGLRVDNWKTKARVTRGFPLGVESTLLDLSFAGLASAPGPIDVAGAEGVLDLVKGIKGITTTRTVVTGNAGAVFRLPHGVNPYFRWGTSYREPGITERYLLRDFGDPTFSVLVIPNTSLRPERGKEFDVGVKVQHSNWNASVSYFRNELKDFVGSAFAPPLFVTPDPARQINPISPFFPFHGVLYVQRTNLARARIQGLEADYEFGLPVRRSVFTVFGSLGWLKGSNLTPDENTLTLLSQFYNRTDTPVPLSGSPDDAPLSSITPFRTINGVRFDSSRRHWFAEYEIRYQGQVTRADPIDLSAAIATEFGTFRSLRSFATQSVRAGYTVRGEKHRVAFTLGLDNLTNRLFFEHFQTAPAPGRSLVFGTTVELLNLLH